MRICHTTFSNKVNKEKKQESIKAELSADVFSSLGSMEHIDVNNYHGYGVTEDCHYDQ